MHLHLKVHVSIVATNSINIEVDISICDRACENRPCEHKNGQFLACLLYHNLINIYTTATKSSSLLENLMGFLLQFTEMG